MLVEVDIPPSPILTLNARWRRVVKITPRPLYPQYPMTRVSPTLRSLQMLVYIVWQQYTETQQLVFVVVFPRFTKASHRNAGLLRSDAVLVYFPKFP
jgi:hypothetical protein